MSTNLVIQNKDNKSFFVEGKRWSNEFPDAMVFPTFASCRRVCMALSAKGHKVMMVRDYGLETQNQIEITLTDFRVSSYEKSENKSKMFTNLSYDGCGINDKDMYRTRIATFVNSDKAKEYGLIFAMAPEMHNLLLKIENSPCLKQYNGDNCICFRCEAKRILSLKS